MLFFFKEILLESYFVVSHSTLLILIRLEKYTLSLQEEHVSVGISNIRNDWNWVVWNGNFSYIWNLKDDSFLSHVHSHYLSELMVWFTSIASKTEHPTTPFRHCLPSSSLFPNTYTATFCPSYSWISTTILTFLMLSNSWCMSRKTWNTKKKPRVHMQSRWSVNGPLFLAGLYYRWHVALYLIPSFNLEEGNLTVFLPMTQNTKIPCSAFAQQPDRYRQCLEYPNGCWWQTRLRPSVGISPHFSFWRSYPAVRGYQYKLC